MQRNEILERIEVGDLMNVGIGRSTDGANRKRAGSRGVDKVARSSGEYRFRRRSTEDTEGALRAAVIVYRAALTRLPAEQQRVIGTASAQEIPLIPLGMKPQKWGECYQIAVRFSQQRDEFAQRNFIAETIQPIEQRIEGRGHDGQTRGMKETRRPTRRRVQHNRSHRLGTSELRWTGIRTF